MNCHDPRLPIECAYWQPDYSPDGKYLAFRSERDGGGIFIVPVLGGAERKVADFGYRPRWSFLFDAARGRINGPGEPITAAGLDAVMPDLTRDGKRLIFAKTQSYSPKSRLWERSLDDGREVLRFADDGYARFAPRWSRDGSRFAYRRRRYINNNQAESAIAVSAANAKEEQLITTPGAANVLAYDWSADGKWILGGTDRENPGRMILPYVGPLEIAFSKDRLILPLMEVSGNIWILENVDR